MVPWRFLLPGQYWSVHRLPEGWNGGVNEDYNDSRQGKFPCKIQGNIEQPDIPAGKKMPDFAVCMDLEDIPMNL